MTNVATEIESKLTLAFEPVHLQVINESDKHHVPKNSETHFLVIIVSDKFKSITRVARQRLVYNCLQAELKSGVHALSQRTYSVEEWQNQKNKSFESPDCKGQ